MNTVLVRLMSRVLIVCMVAMPLRLQAGPLGTDALLTPAQAYAARDAVRGFLQRADAAGQLQVLGLSAQAARERVDALTDAEVVRLAGQIDSLPAGADGAGMGFIIILLFLFWRFYADPSLAEKEKPAAKRTAPAKEAPKK